ncbi:MAG: carbohydrate ABC transporter permease [Limnochordia bacterium]|nr:carbohydrate ABC transporter permease [Limnochordia bacterium]
MKQQLRLERPGRALLFLVILAASIIMLLPFLWMVSTSLKEPGAVFGLQLQLIPKPIVWDNYKRIFEVLPFGRFYWNSIVTSAAVTLLQLVTCSFAGYAFARLKFPGRDTLFLGYLATLMIPGQVTIIPNFIMLRMLGWIDTYQALILPNAFSAFGTFLLRQFFSTLPADLEDAAKIDGCSHFGIYRHVILPLSKPALSSLTVFTWLGQWNSFIWPLIVINSVKMNTLTVGLRTLQGQYNTQWTLLMAGSVLALLPVLILFVLAQRTFISGMALSGMGGR